MTIHKKSPVGDLLQPAFVLALMSGLGVRAAAGASDVRATNIRGEWDLFWAEGQAMRGTGPDPLVEAWHTHGAALTADAAAAGFRPHYVAGDTWSAAEQAAEIRWRDEFLRVHGVRPLR